MRPSVWIVLGAKVVGRTYQGHSWRVRWEEMTPSDAVENADWIGPRMHPFNAYDVGMVIPTGFAAYARILHPAGKFGDPRPVEVRWSEIAAWSRKTIHPEVQFHAIAEPASGDELALWPWNYEPRNGVLSPGQIRGLGGLLAAHTTTQDQCWFCLWEGQGYLHPGGVAPLIAIAAKGPKPLQWLRLRAARRRLQRRKPPRISGRRVTPNQARSYLLFSGSLSDAAGWEDGPNLWWPEDRAWCVASEIDHCYSYVGGSTDLINELLVHPALEAVPAKITDGITYDSDRINSPT
jgi:hypothetical protein